MYESKINTHTRYKIRVERADGSEYIDPNWYFNNLLDVGLQRFNSPTDQWIRYIELGTNQNPVQFTDTGVLTPVVSIDLNTYDLNNPANHTVTKSENDGTVILTHRYTVSAICNSTSLISEVGITSVSRALIQQNGSPAPIPVTVGDRVVVVAEVIHTMAGIRTNNYINVNTPTALIGLNYRTYHKASAGFASITGLNSLLMNEATNVIVAPITSLTPGTADSDYPVLNSPPNGFTSNYSNVVGQNRTMFNTSFKPTTTVNVYGFSIQNKNTGIDTVIIFADPVLVEQGYKFSISPYYKFDRSPITIPSDYEPLQLKYKTPSTTNYTILTVTPTSGLSSDWGYYVDPAYMSNFSKVGNTICYNSGLAANTEFNIWVYASSPMTQIRLTDTDSAQSNLLEVVKWGTIPMANLAFYNARSLTKVPLSSPVNVTSWANMFDGATTFNDANVSNWVTSHVTSTAYMFRTCSLFNKPLNWDMGNNTDTSYMFYNCNVFNSSVENWDLRKVTNMTYMFYGCENFNQPLTGWLTRDVANMSFMFQNTNEFNQPLTHLNVSNVTTMAQMFRQALKFNQPLNGWDTGKVTTFDYMFTGAIAFNGDIDQWNTVSCTSTVYMFSSAASFNKPIGSWNVTNLSIATGMFNSATAFNQHLDTWVTSSLTQPSNMFANATAFNGRLDTWNVSNVQTFNYMFQNASSFNQPLNSWNTISAVQMVAMFNGASSFNQPLNNWITNNVNSFTSMFNGATMFNGDVTTWATGNSTSFNSMFHSATNFNQNISSWNTSKGQLFDYMFYEAVSFNQNLSTWGMGAATTTAYMFYGTTVFNSPLSGWDVSKVTDMTGMFMLTGAFNQYIGDWNVGLVNNMSYMFSKAAAFNQPLTNWNTVSVTQLRSFIAGPNCAFNQPLNHLNVSNVVSLKELAWNNTSFNQPLNLWNTVKVTDMSYAFAGSVFNQPIATWNTSIVTSMAYMFQGALEFNQPINSWDVSKVGTFASMFESSVKFNQYIGDWVIYRTSADAVSLTAMFASTVAFNQPLTNWTFNAGFSGSSITSFLYQAQAFKQDLNHWRDLYSFARTSEPTNFATNSVLPHAMNPWRWDSRLILSGAIHTNTKIYLLSKDGSLPYSTSTIGGSSTDITVTATTALFRGSTVNVWKVAYPAQTTVKEIILNVTDSCQGFFMEPDDDAHGDTIIDTSIPVTVNAMPDMIETFSFRTRQGMRLIVPANKSLDPGKTDTNEHRNPKKVTNYSDAFTSVVFSDATGLTKWYMNKATNMSSMFKSTNFTVSSPTLTNALTGGVTVMTSAFESSNYNAPMGHLNVGAVTNMDMMYKNATNFDQDLTTWCVTNIPSEPTEFSLNAPLTGAHKPVWGTCPITP